MKRFLLLMLLSATSCLTFAQICYTPVVHSKGNYDLAGKKYFIQQVVYDSVGVEASDVRVADFCKYLRQSLALRGAVNVDDSSEADFIVKAGVHFWDEEVDVSLRPSPAPGRRAGGKGARADSWKLTREEGAWYWDDWYSTHGGATVNLGVDPRKVHDNKRDSGISNKRTSQGLFFHKIVVIDAFDATGSSENPLWQIRVNSYNRSLGFRGLCPNQAILFMAAGYYGKTIDRKTNLDFGNDYYDLFSKNKLGSNKNVSFAPEAQSSSRYLSVLLVEHQPNKTIVVVKDWKRYGSDKIRFAPYIRIGDETLPCEEISYNVNRYHQGERLLTMKFPPIGDAEDFDLLFCKKNHPDKVKISLKNIQL